MATKQAFECFVARDGTHTSIVVNRTDKAVTLIPMETLTLTTLTANKFDRVWEPYLDYPVRRAAERYLAEQHRQIPPQTRERLQGIVDDKSTAYKPLDSTSTQRKTEMTKSAVLKNTAATLSGAATTAVPATSKAPHPLRRSTDKPTAAKAPVKAAAKAPAKAAAKTPAKAAAKAPAKAAAPAKTAAPAAKKAAGPRAAKEDNTPYKVADDSSVKRGFLREYVDHAKGLKKFTRDALVSAFKGKQEDERLVRYFYYCTGNGIFSAA